MSCICVCALIPYVYYVKHEFAKKSLKYTIPKTINDTPTFIKDKVHTHSLNGFKSYTKTYFLSCYSLECSSPQKLLHVSK